MKRNDLIRSGLWASLTQVLFVASLLVMLYALSAVPVTVVIKRQAIPPYSKTVQVLAQFYAPLFGFMRHVPGAEDAFVSLTDHLARLHR